VPSFVLGTKRTVGKKPEKIPLPKSHSQDSKEMHSKLDGEKYIEK
jgi:hypothetical protein